MLHASPSNITCYMNGNEKLPLIVLASCFLVDYNVKYVKPGFYWSLSTSYRGIEWYRNQKDTDSISTALCHGVIWRERARDKNTNSVIWCFRAMWWWLLNSTLCNGVWWILYNGQSELFRIIFNHGWTEIRLNVRWPYFSVGLLNESFPSAIQTTYYTYRK